MTIKDSIASRNAKADAFAPLCNTGYIRFYTGAMPATPETAASGTLLATLRFGATAFPAASGGVLTANAITADSSAAATGDAGYVRILKSDGTTVLMDGDVTIIGGGGFITLGVAQTTIVAGATVELTSLTLTFPQ